MRLTQLLLFVLLLAGIAGCQQENDTSATPDQAATTQQAPTSSLQSMPDELKSGIWFEPATLSTCARPQAIVVHWDASSFEGIKSVELVAVNPAGKQVVFASAGRVGSRESGAWMRAGSRMILRDKASGTQLAEAIVGSEPCPANGTAG